MSFAERRERRENGTARMSAYRLFWRGARWEPLLTSAASLQKSASSGAALGIAMLQESTPGVYELAIADKKLAGKRIKVYVSSTGNLRAELVGLVGDGGALRAFMDHALKEKHVLWLRCKPTPDEATAQEHVNQILDKYDYAWVVQPAGKPRSLVVRQKFLCCGAISTGVNVKEGPPKFVQQKSGLLKMLSGSRKR